MSYPETILKENANRGKQVQFESEATLDSSQLRAWDPSLRNVSYTPTCSDNLKRPSVYHESQVLKDDSNRQARACRSESSLANIKQTDENNIFGGRVLETIDLNKKDKVRIVFISYYCSIAAPKKRKGRRYLCSRLLRPEKSVHAQVESSMSVGEDDRRNRRQSKFFHRECEMRPEAQDHHSARSDKTADACVPDAFVESTPVSQCTQEGLTEQISAVSIRHSPR